MKILICTLLLCLLNWQLSMAQITISNSTVYFKLGYQGSCLGQNPNPRIYINGSYNISSAKYNGRHQYLLTLPFSNTSLICLYGFSGRTIYANSHLRLRWSGTAWVLGFLTSASTFETIVTFSNDSPNPLCQAVGNFSTTISGNDCYCQSSLDLTGSVVYTIPRAAQTTLISNQKFSETSLQLYQAGQSITLTPGFEVATGGVFESKIAACN